MRLRPISHTTCLAIFLCAISVVGIACAEAEETGDSAAASKSTSGAAREASDANASDAASSPAPPAGHSEPSYTVRFETTAGEILIDVHSDWAPLGAARFRELVEAGFYDDTAFFRVIKGFMAQLGIAGDPKVNDQWRMNRIKDDKPMQSNTRGMVSFATSGPHSRTTQFFINYGDNSRLDGMGFAPFGVVRDMTAVDALNGEYGEGAPRGRGPSQGTLGQQGNAYLRRDFPNLDYITKATIVQ